MHEFVTTDLDVTMWDLARRGWTHTSGDVWSNGTRILRVYTPDTRPFIPVSAMRWEYDGTTLRCLDPDHRHEIRIDEPHLGFLKSCLVQEHGWLHVDLAWLTSIVRLAQVLPMPLDQGVTREDLEGLFTKCVEELAG